MQSCYAFRRGYTKSALILVRVGGCKALSSYHKVREVSGFGMDGSITVNGGVLRSPGQTRSLLHHCEVDPKLLGCAFTSVLVSKTLSHTSFAGESFLHKSLMSDNKID